jgi:HEAT repeat protein
MKRFLSAVFLCGSLLATGSVYFLQSAEAKEDIVLQLLNLPAPPPPNPLVPLSARRDESFYDESNPPKDDAPIEDLIEYWSRQNAGYEALRYNPKASPRVVERLMAEVRSNPAESLKFLNVFEDDPGAIRMLKDIYDAGSGNNSLESEELATLRNWLVDNSPHFPDELERKAERYAPTGEYVSNHYDMLALTKQDWNRAAPIVNRAYNDRSSPVARVGAMWALYRHALAEDSIGDIDRYRDELKAVVEDKSATNGMRDLALDALVTEKEWSGRDDWYYSLLADETLADLRVNGSSYTGLTTLILYSPADKYRDKMIDLAKSDNKTIKNAAVKNLVVLFRRGSDETITRALLPWLSDANWASESDEGGRQALVRALIEYKIPESVPGLIHLLNEKPPRPENANSSAPRRWATTNSNSVVTTSNLAVISPEDPPPSWVASNAMRIATNSSVTTTTYYNEDHYPFRYSALSALAKQADMRAVPALRRMMNSTADYERTMVINALLTSGGFTIPEQVDALVATVRAGDNLESANTNAIYTSNHGNYTPGRTVSLQEAIGTQLMRSETVGDDVVRAVIERMDSLERREPIVAEGLRKVVQGWDGPAVNMMMLRDLKNGKSNGEAVIKLLANRKELREKQPTDVFDLRTGTPMAIGLAGCILEDTNDMASLLASGNNAATTAMLACARLIRAELPVAAVTPLLRSPDRGLALAAERYLLSEDSPEARAAVLSLYPNQAKITGASTFFEGENASFKGLWEDLAELFASVSPYYSSADYASAGFYPGDFSAIEKQLQEEVIADKDLLGVYSYENFNVRIFADRAVFSIREDDARYRERVLTTEEFDDLKSLLAYHKVAEQPPYLSCTTCEPRQLLMLGRAGGRRLFVKATKMPELFAGLDSFFGQVSQSQLRLKYTASKELPGLEVLFADDSVAAEAVWKNGPEIRLLITNRAARERVQKEIEETVANAMETFENSEDEEEATEGRAGESPWTIGQQLRIKREFEGIDWLGLAGERLSGQVPPPPGFDIPPVRDSLSVPAAFERWKARAGDLEIRADNEALYKVRGGTLTKIGTGYYSYPLLTPNGRWVIVNKYNDEGNGLVRVNVQTGREFPVDLSEQPADMGIVFIPSINRFLLGSMVYSDDHHYEGEGEAESDPGATFARPVYRPSSFLLLDPETGTIRNAPGEYRPLTHQTFRQLQPAGKPNEFWAAIPDENKNETVVGVYNAAVFGFKPILKVPKIQFDSLDMWVDQGKVYFVYKGHLLAAPLPAG